MIACWLVILTSVREPRRPFVAVSRGAESVDERHDREAANHSLLWLMFATLAWGLGFDAFGAFFTLYAVKVLAVPAGRASLMLMLFSASVLISAIPAGILGTRLGRRRTMLIGMVAAVLLFIPLSVIGSVPLVSIALALFGLCMAMINVNAIPMVAEIAGSSRIGRYTGYYFVFVSLAAVFGPPLFGLVRDISRSYGALFAFTGASYAISALCMLFVRHGEAGSSATSRCP